MKLRVLFIIPFIPIFYSCNKDEPRTCTTCTSEATAPFEVCREPDGTASVNGENTETDFNAYVDALQETGANCGS